MQIEKVNNQPSTDNQPLETYLATLEQGQKIRTVIVRNPVTGEMDSGFVLKDLAEAFSYGTQALKRIYLRSKRLKKYLVVAVMASTADGKMYNHDVVAGREGLLGGFLKLQSNRIADPVRREKIDAIQEQLVHILVAVLKGYQTAQTKQARIDRAVVDLQYTSRLELFKAISGAQIREIMKAYGYFTGRKVLNILFGIDPRDIEMTQPSFER